jgi:two-component system response regulator (stage 0 sporulation protein A)
MCEKLSILLIEDDVNACYEFRDYINDLDDVFLSNMTNDSYQAIQLVKDQLPHVIILDLELSNGNGNGLTFLHDLNKLEIPFHPFVLVTTNNSSQITYTHARNSGADFILYKHQKDYSPKMVIDLLCSMKKEIMNVPSNTISYIEENQAKEERLHRITKRVESELIKIGISPKAKGFQYLCDGIRFYIEDPSRITQRIAILYKKSEPSVERAMQNAINKAWTINDTERLYKYYTAIIHSDKGVPTLLEFISYYAKKIKTEYLN